MSLRHKLRVSGNGERVIQPGSLCDSPKLGSHPYHKGEFVAFIARRDLPTSGCGKVDTSPNELIVFCPSPDALSIALEWYRRRVYSSSRDGQVRPWFSARIIVNGLRSTPAKRLPTVATPSDSLVCNVKPWLTTSIAGSSNRYPKLGLDMSVEPNL
jgi:hypothetical protein